MTLSTSSQHIIEGFQGLFTAQDERSHLQAQGGAGAVPQQPSVRLPPSLHPVTAPPGVGIYSYHRASELFSESCWPFSALQVLCHKAENRFVSSKILCKMKLLEWFLIAQVCSSIAYLCV